VQFSHRIHRRQYDVRNQRAIFSGIRVFYTQTHGRWAEGLQACLQSVRGIASAQRRKPRVGSRRNPWVYDSRSRACATTIKVADSRARLRAAAVEYYGVESMARYMDCPLNGKCGRAGVAPEHGFDPHNARTGEARPFPKRNQSKPFACFMQLRGPHDRKVVRGLFDTLVDPPSLRLPRYRPNEVENTCRGARANRSRRRATSQNAPTRRFARSWLCTTELRVLGPL